MCTVGEMITDLNCVGAAEALLLNDGGDALARSEQESSDRRRNGSRDLSDLLVADDTGPR